MISTIILTKNEEKNIRDCLEGLVWSDEILVVDDYSTDKTVPIAQKMGARVVSHHLDSFAHQRNFALEKARGEWILFVDADERVTRLLAAEIIQVVKTDKHDAYYLKRQDFWQGKLLRFGETGKIQLLRLAKKTYGQWHGAVHEIWQVPGTVGELNSPLLHYPHPRIRNFLTEINRYTDLRVGDLKMAGTTFSVISLGKPLAKFIVNYFFHFGFLDGFAGLTQATLMSLHSLMVRVKLYEQTQLKTY